MPTLLGATQTAKPPPQPSPARTGGAALKVELFRVHGTFRPDDLPPQSYFCAGRLPAFIFFTDFLPHRSIIAAAMAHTKTARCFLCTMPAAPESRRAAAHFC